MADIVGYKTSTGTIGTLKTQAALTFNYDVDYIDFTMILDAPDIPTRARGWFAKTPYFNGFHLSEQYNVRVYLNEGDSADLSLQSGTSRDIINLLNGQFITLDTLFNFNVAREVFTPEDSDSAVIVDSDYVPPDSDVILSIDSAGALNIGNAFKIGNWTLEQYQGDFYITQTDTANRILRIDSDGTVNVNGTFTENGDTIYDNILSTVDSAYVSARVTLDSNALDELATFIDSDFLNSVIDSDYINNRLDSSFVTDIVDSDYVKDRQTDGGADEIISGGDY